MPRKHEFKSAWTKRRSQHAFRALSEREKKLDREEIREARKREMLLNQMERNRQYF